MSIGHGDLVLVVLADPYRMTPDCPLALPARLVEVLEHLAGRLLRDHQGGLLTWEGGVVSRVPVRRLRAPVPPVIADILAVLAVGSVVAGVVVHRRERSPRRGAAPDRALSSDPDAVLAAARALADQT